MKSEKIRLYAICSLELSLVKVLSPILLLKLKIKKKKNNKHRCVLLYLLK